MSRSATASFRVLAALVTPFRSDLSIDQEALASHCHKLLAQGCHGLVLFGTTGEAASLTHNERKDVLEALLARDIPAGRLLVGTGSCALGEAAELTRHATARGVGGVLVIPPFYFKPVGDDGLFAWYSTLIEQCTDLPLRLHLYHFPAISGVAIKPALAARLSQAFPVEVAGYKDSGGDLSHTRQIIAAMPDLEVRVGSEAQFLDTVEAGGAGCISATINVFAREAVALAHSLGSDRALHKQQALASRRLALRQLPSITAVKHLLAARYEQPSWSLVRPPLLALSDAEARILDQMESQQFAATA